MLDSFMEGCLVSNMVVLREPRERNIESALAARDATRQKPVSEAKVMRRALILLFGVILGAMLTVTTTASLDRSIFDVGSQLTSDPWFHATLADCYFGFLTCYVWVAYKERAIWRRVVWFVLIMTLGNIAMSIYMLIQLRRWDASRGVESLLLRTDDFSSRKRRVRSQDACQ